MNRNEENPPQAHGSSDSLLGVALTQAWVGFAYGPSFDLAWKAGETCSAIYEDRKASEERVSARGAHSLGAKGKLAATFGLHTTHSNKNPPLLLKQWILPSSHAFAL